MRTVLLARSLLAIVILLAALSAAAAAGGPSRVHAQQGPVLQVTPSSAGPGESITLRGSGWPAGATLVARIHEASELNGPNSTLAMAFQADAEGSFSAQATVPLTLFSPAGSRGNLAVVPGSYTILVSAGPGVTVGVPFSVVAPAGEALLWGQVAFDTNGNRQRDSADTPAGGFVWVSAKGSAQEGPARQAMTDARGRYVLPSLQADQYTLGAQGQFQSANWTGAATATVGSGQAVRADLLLRPAATGLSPERYFKETGFYVDNDAFWDYFTHRGGVRTLGYPISRTFRFQGHPTQFFQRIVLQEVPGQGVQRLNLLDPDLLPYTSINGSRLPAVDSEVKAATPAADLPDYDARVIDFVRRHAPNEVGGRQVGFFDAFMGTVSGQDAFPNGGGHEELLPLLNLEIWGVPTSRPTPDPNNSNFVYLRFQRGIMHFQGHDGRGDPITEGLLLGDWFKSLITGQNLPPDLEAQARADSSPYLRQYDPNRPNWVADPHRLPDTSLSFAFEPQ